MDLISQRIGSKPGVRQQGPHAANVRYSPAMRTKPVYWCGVVAAVLITAALVLHAQGGPPATAGTAKNDAVVAATSAVFDEMSKIRELSVLRPVKSGTQSRQAIEQMVVRALDEQTTPAQMHASEVTLKKLGMVPADFQFRAFVRAILTEQVAGYYDPKAREFYVADWIDLDAQKPVMAHELTHALQDQHFDLQRLAKWPHGDADAELAAHALVEGDATLAMAHYAFAHPDLLAAFAASASGASEQLMRAPRSLRENLVFPFEKGLMWVTQLQQRGGWMAVSRAFEKMPLSSEQILHLDKYDAYEAPVKVAIPAIDSLLGRGWARIDEDVQGEWGYYSLLDEFLKAPETSQAAAAGWGGDRYAVYQGPAPGDVCLVQVSAWDTPADAREFADAYARRSGLRYGVTPGPNGPQPWRTAEGGVAIDLRGNRVVIVEGIPAAANGAALVARLWQ
jgi:hypothetical protein